MEVCELLWMPISAKCEWTWNSIYQSLHDKTKEHHQEECNHGVLQCKKQLYLKLYVSVSLEASLLQVMSGMQF